MSDIERIIYATIIIWCMFVIVLIWSKFSEQYSIREAYEENYKFYRDRCDSLQTRINQLEQKDASDDI